MNNRIFKKIISITIITTLLFSNLTVFAETEKTKSPIPQRDYKEATSPADGITTDFFECSASKILANILKIAITELIGAIIEGLLGDIVTVKVPTKSEVLEGKDVGLTIGGYPILPSWDAAAYCLANATIAYLADATIYWIRTGFEGNPAFVEDPEKFFRKVADMEHEDFLENVAAELACDPFKVSITNVLSKNYNRKFSDRGKCTLYDGDGDVDGFLSGDSFDFDVYYRYTQDNANNPLGSTIMLEEEMNRRINSKQASISIELDWSKGYLPWKDKDGKTVSMGSAVEMQLEKSLGISKDRLALADEFDEVIDELVNYLIKYALDETIGALE